MYTVSSCIWYFPLVTLTLRVMLLLGEVRECWEVTFTKECEWPVTERMQLLSLKTRCVIQMRGRSREWMQTLALPRVFTFDLRRTCRSVTLQSITDVKPASPVPNHCTPLRSHQAISYCRYFSPESDLFIFLFSLVIAPSLSAPIVRDMNSCVLLTFWNNVPANSKQNCSSG